MTSTTWSPVSDVEDPHRSVVPVRRRDPFAVRAEGHAPYLALGGTADAPDQITGAWVPHVDGAIVAAGRQPRAVSAEGHHVDVALVAGERRESCTRLARRGGR